MPVPRGRVFTEMRIDNIALEADLIVSLPDGAEATLELTQLRVTPSDVVLAGLERMFGDTVAELR